MGVLDDFPEEITETPETPAASNLFNVRDDNERELLYETRAQAFHHTVAQLLFNGIRCSKDAHTSIAFLTLVIRKAIDVCASLMHRIPVNSSCATAWWNAWARVS